MTFRDRNLADYLRADRVDRAEHDGPVVEVTDVRLSFGGLNVLNDVSFHVAHRTAQARRPFSTACPASMCLRADRCGSSVARFAG